MEKNWGTKLAKDLYFSAEETDMYEAEEVLEKFCYQSKFLKIDNIADVLRKLPGVKLGPIVIYKIIQIEWPAGISFNFYDQQNNKFSVSFSLNTIFTKLRAPLIYFGDESISYITRLYEIVKTENKEPVLNLIMEDYRSFRRIRALYPRYLGKTYMEFTMEIREVILIACKLETTSTLEKAEIEKIKCFLTNYEGSEEPKEICKALKKEVNFTEKLKLVDITTILERTNEEKNYKE